MKPYIVEFELEPVEKSERLILSLSYDKNGHPKWTLKSHHQWIEGLTKEHFVQMLNAVKTTSLE